MRKSEKPLATQATFLSCCAFVRFRCLVQKMHRGRSVQVYWRGNIPVLDEVGAPP